MWSTSGMECVQYEMNLSLPSMVTWVTPETIMIREIAQIRLRKTNTTQCHLHVESKNSDLRNRNSYQMWGKSAGKGIGRVCSMSSNLVRQKEKFCCAIIQYSNDIE